MEFSIHIDRLYNDKIINKNKRAKILNKIDASNLLSLMMKYGSLSINYFLSYNNKKIINEIHNEFFIPISIIEKEGTFNTIPFYNNKLLLNGCNIQTESYLFNGYIKADPLNKYIEKTNFITLDKEYDMINRFYDYFIYSEKEIKIRIENYYNFKKILKYNFNDLLLKITKFSKIQIYYIICLYLSQDNNKSIFTGQFIYNIYNDELIYDNLPFHLQIKLNKKQKAKIIPNHIQDIILRYDESYKSKIAIEGLRSYPWYNSYNYDINKLNDVVYGFNELKDIIRKWINNTHNAISIYGPTGIGKTFCINQISKLTNIPVSIINLGNVNDKGELIGYNYVYNDSYYGLIIQEIIKSKNTKMILFFDELDKTNDDIMNTLIHVIDPNSLFRDNFYRGITFDLSNILFIFAYNESNKINKALKDRIYEIKINAYTNEEKIIIANNYLNYNDNEKLLKIIKSTNESGVRDLIRKLNNNDFQIQQNLEFEESQAINKFIPKNIGFTNCLCVDNFGNGYVCQVQIKYSSEIIITGNISNRTKESIYIAFTMICNFLNIQYKSFHFHITNNFKKNGISGGPSFALAFYSLFTQKYISKKIACTGELDLDGNIYHVENIENKIIGAMKNNIKRIYVPGNYENGISISHIKDILTHEKLI